MKALVTGAGGQLGVALLASAPAGWAAVGLTRAGSLAGIFGHVVQT